MRELPYVEPSTLLFRYLDHRTEHFWQAIEEMLSQQRLFLNSRIRFNDPFDSKPEIVNDVSNSEIRAYAREMLQSPWLPERDSSDIAKILQLKESGKTKLKGRNFKEIKRGLVTGTNEFLDEGGLSSFSLTATNPVLWGHYAAGSAGVCVVFKRGESLASAFAVCARVSYVEERPKLPTSLFIKMTRTQRAGLPFGEIADEIFFLSFLHKSKE